jgi:hypothetical protein
MEWWYSRSNSFSTEDIAAIVDAAIVHTKTNKMNLLKKLFETSKPEKPPMSYDHAILKASERDAMLEALFDSQREILSKKGYDYAGEDILSNFRLAGMIVNQSSNNPDAVNCLNLIGTKVARLGQLLSSNKEAYNESIQDSVIDLCNYSALLYLILKVKD